MIPDSVLLYLYLHKITSPSFKFIDSIIPHRSVDYNRSLPLEGKGDRRTVVDEVLRNVDIRLRRSPSSFAALPQNSHTANIEIPLCDHLISQPIG